MKLLHPTRILLPLVLILFWPNRSGLAQHAGHHGEHEAAGSDELILGAIDFPTSGSPEAQEAFLRGALALHSFWYPEARDHFRKAREVDPGFAMAYWGEAMTHDHPLWLELDTTAGRNVLADLDAIVASGEVKWTEREKAFVDALRIIYAEGPPEDHRVRFADAMQTLAKQHPEDDEATVFAALARMTVPGFDGEKAEDVVAVAAPLEQIYQRSPNHPGAVHYLIHVYDSPVYAPMGLRVARVYAEIAPASSHAIHMPSHIFRELGMWEEMAASNERAYQASIDWQERTGRPLSSRDYHAYEWMLDAYLKLGRYADARRLVDEFSVLVKKAEARGEDGQQMVVNGLGYELRYATAARLAGLPTPSVEVPPEIDASTLPAYTVGTVAEVASLAGDDSTYQKAVERLRYFLALPTFAEYRNAVEAGLKAMKAERMRAAGDLDGAVVLAREAMEQELSEKETDFGYGTVKLAELLLETGEAAEAAVLFERLMTRRPRDPRYTLGLARAFVRAGEPTAAAARYAELADIWHAADAGIPALEEAVGFVPELADR